MHSGQKLANMVDGVQSTRPDARSRFRNAVGAELLGAVFDMLFDPGLDNALPLLGPGGEYFERLPGRLAVQLASALARDRGDIDAFSARDERRGIDAVAVRFKRSRRRRGDPAGALEAVGNRSHFQIFEIRAWARASLPPAGQANRLPSSDRGTGLPSGASGPNPAEGAGNPFGLDLDPGAHARLGQDRHDAAPNQRRPGGEPAGFQSRGGAGLDIAGRRRRARPSPIEVPSGRLAPPPWIQQDLRKCSSNSR